MTWILIWLAVLVFGLGLVAYSLYKVSSQADKDMEEMMRDVKRERK
jgi:hypothetical protein